MNRATTRLSRALLTLVMCSAAWAQTLYWVESTFDSPRMARADAGGGSVEELSLTPGSLPLGVAIDRDAGEVFISSLAYTDAAISVTDLDLSGASPVHSTSPWLASCVCRLGLKPNRWSILCRVLCCRLSWGVCQRW